MMKQDYSDLYACSIILLLFGASVGILHGSKKPKLSVETKELIDLKPEEIINYLQPLIQARGLDSIAVAFKQFVPIRIKEVLEQLLQEKDGPLTVDQVVQLLFRIVDRLSFDEAWQNVFFGLLVDHGQPISVTVPFLLDLAKSNHSRMVDELFLWASRSNNLVLFDHWAKDAINAAIEQNDYQGLQALYDHNIRILPEKASKLLLFAVQRNTSPDFIHLLIHFGADVNYQEQGKTALMHAAESGNEAILSALLDEGAQPNQIIDPAVGSALQIATEKGNPAVEELLRRYNQHN